MRYLLVIVLLFFFTACAFAKSDFLDVDYNFIDTAFDGIKPVTDKEFDDTINKLTPQPVENTFGGRLKAFLFGRKYGVESAPKGQDVPVDFGGERKAIADLVQGVFYIRLVAPVISADGGIIPLGNYKIQQQIIDDKPMLVFYQGRNEYGALRLQEFEDTLKKENELNYSRVDIISDDIIRIVYATLDDTKCALAKVYLQN